MTSKIFGVLVTYKPDMSILEKSIDSLKNQLDKLIVIDNTPGKCENLENLKKVPNIEILYLGDNYGIAYAQNVGIKKSLRGKG